MKIQSLKLSSLGLLTGAIALGFGAISANAATITQGFTFSVAEAGGGTGDHFHSNTGGAFGNPAGLAEVGGLGGTEEVRGLSEYNLAGLTPAASVFVTFDVNRAGGLFGQAAGAFGINLFGYAGNNLENLSDFQAASIGSLGTFNTGGLLVGNTLSFDITALYNARIAASATSLGIRLQEVVINRGPTAYVFNNFRLTTTNDSTTMVPEPGTALIGLLTLGVCVGGRFSRSRSK